MAGTWRLSAPLGGVAAFGAASAPVLDAGNP